ncbi:helix-turn-helix domain-containing protein [Salinibacillus aidingensis]|uniref:Helix-turn-helix domain-containing protein n=1 Tax=Salinibacillus aidingensis TaxID=237684 RepID=A0ABN1BF54_9BACI
MELGQRLKEAREEKGLSLSDIQEMTKIQRRYLNAIEEGQFNILPGSFYTRAFIREYANTVGLNADQLFEEYENELPSPEQEEYERISRVQKHSKQPSSEKHSALFSVIPKILTVLLIVAIIVFAYFFYQQTIDPEESPEQDNPDEVEITRGDQSQQENKNDDNGSDQKETEKKENGDQNSEENENSGSSESNSDTGDAEKPQTEVNLTNQSKSGGLSAEYEVKLPDDKFNVTLTTSKKSWLTIRDANEQVIFDKMLTSDNSPKEFDFSDQKSVTMRIGQAAAVDIKVNDTNLKYAFDPKKPKNYVQDITLKVVQ